MLDKEPIPRYAIFRGRKCRVIGYAGNGRFEILDPKGDITRRLSRQFITFVKEKKQ